MSDCKLTIFTPTKDRGYIIGDCYQSLIEQTYKNFIWLIVDDGSTDNTEEIIGSFIAENKIEIMYIKQKNSGKHVAHNTGVLNCKTDLFVCLDSDDTLAPNAVESIYDNLETVFNDNLLAGIMALKKNRNINTQPLKSCFPTNIERSSIRELYETFHFVGEIFLVFKTNILKQFLFPVFPGEKFVTEAVVYDQISEKYKMLLLNEVLYIYEYLDDGYSKNINLINIQNPHGYMYFYEQRIKMAHGIKNKYDAISRYISACITIKDLSFFWNCNNSFLKIVCIPNGIWLFLKPKIKKQLSKYKLISNSL